jgi:NAD+ synthase (glutamine-hydrolysing)
MIVYTRYIGSPYSGSTTAKRAEKIGEHMGANHATLQMKNILDSFMEFCKDHLDGMIPKFKSQGGGWQEDLALQNIQARIRMIYSYMLAQTLGCSEDTDCIGKDLLVLATGNVDEILMGYATKYDCSSGDIAPIATLNKHHVFSIIKYSYDKLGWEVLSEILNAAPTAELQPSDGSHVQTDEEDMGLTYNELATFGRYRMDRMCGPFSMFDNLQEIWPEMPIELLEEKVLRFFKRFGMNRHKAVVGTPAIHLSNYSADPKTRDVRPYLYTGWETQFRKISKLKEDVLMCKEAGDDCVRAWMMRR